MLGWPQKHNGQGSSWVSHPFSHRASGWLSYKSVRIPASSREEMASCEYLKATQEREAIGELTMWQMLEAQGEGHTLAVRGIERRDYFSATKKLVLVEFGGRLSQSQLITESHVHFAEIFMCVTSRNPHHWICTPYVCSSIYCHKVRQCVTVWTWCDCVCNRKTAFK